MDQGSEVTATTNRLPRNTKVTREGEENRCPPLVSLNVTARMAETNKVVTKLELEFNEHDDSGITAGEVRFSLTRAKLTFQLAGCRAPASDRKVNSPYSMKTEVHRTEGKASTNSLKEEGESGVGFKFKPNEVDFDLQQKKKYGSNDEDSYTRSEEFTFTHFNVVSGGGHHQPHWVFTPARGREFLKGTIVETNWATVTVDRTPATIAAIVTVASDDIEIKGTGGLWLRLLTDRKRGVARLLALRQLKFKPHLCKIDMVCC